MTRQRRRFELGKRSTGDLLVLMIAGTVCVAVLAAGATIAVIELVHPSSDTSRAMKSVQDVINTLLGLVAGFLAGRSYRLRPGDVDELDEPVDDDEPNG